MKENIILMAAVLAAITLFISAADTGQAAALYHNCTGKLCTIFLNDIKQVEIEEMSNTDICLTDCKTVLRIRPVNVPLNIPASPNANFAFNFSPGVDMRIEMLSNITETALISVPNICVPYNLTENSTTVELQDCTPGAPVYAGVTKESWVPSEYYGISMAANTNYLFRISGKKSPAENVYHYGTWLGEPLTELSWWNTSFSKKKPINVSIGSTVAGIALPFNVTYDADMNADFSDIRFTGQADSSEVPYYIEYAVNSSWAYVWVNSTYADTNGTQLYMYYGGCPSCASASNGTNTFIMFDEFDGSALDAAKWSTSGTGTATVDNGAVTVWSTTENWYGIRSAQNFTRPFLTKYYVDDRSSPANGYNTVVALTRADSFVSAVNARLFQDNHKNADTTRTWKFYKEDNVTAGTTDYQRTTDADETKPRITQFDLVNNTHYSAHETGYAMNATNRVANATLGWVLGGSTAAVKSNIAAYGNAGNSSIVVNKTFVTKYYQPEPSYIFAAETSAGLIVGNGSMLNGTYYKNSSSANITLQVLNLSPADAAGATYMEYDLNGTRTNVTMVLIQNGTSGSNFSYVANFTNWADGNYSIFKFWSNSSGSGEMYSNSTTHVIVVDSAYPEANLTRTGTNGFLAGSNINFTWNITDANIQNATFILYAPGGSVNTTFNRTGNVTLSAPMQINTSASETVGNWTVNLSIWDMSGNMKNFTEWFGFGKLDFNASSRLIAVNYTTRPGAWGSTGIDNNTKTNLTTRLNISAGMIGYVVSASDTVYINLSTIFDNWTDWGATNESGSAMSPSQGGTWLNWTSDVMSSGTVTWNLMNISSTNAANYTYRNISSTSSDFLIASGYNKSFNIYARLNLPFSVEKTSNHLRYFVCTGTITRDPIDCSAFSTAIDVTSSNNGDNSVSNYPVNLFGHDDSEPITDATLQTNNTDFLIRISSVSGAWASSGGPAGGPSGGGGGGFIEEIILQQQTVCPEGYLYNGTSCNKLIPRTDIFLERLTEPRIGPLSLVHIALIGAFAAIVLKYKKAQSIINGRKVRL